MNEQGGLERETSLDSEEEDECRVCRGPAEEGRPLRAPCKCSGSIGLTHQDCLTSWLEVTRRDGRCELCKTKFRFAPLYADNAPTHLSPMEVVLGLSRRILARWLPFGFRVTMAAALWLALAPLITNYLYHAWIHRPSSILARFTWELVLTDIVSGAIVMAIIIVSFLSLMSFVDFLRAHWQMQGRREQMAAAARVDGVPPRRRHAGPRFPPPPHNDDDDDEQHDAQFRELHQRIRAAVQQPEEPVVQDAPEQNDELAYERHGEEAPDPIHLLDDALQQDPDNYQPAGDETPDQHAPEPIQPNDNVRSDGEPPDEPPRQIVGDEDDPVVQGRMHPEQVARRQRERAARYFREGGLRHVDEVDELHDDSDYEPDDDEQDDEPDEDEPGQQDDEPDVRGGFAAQFDREDVDVPRGRNEGGFGAFEPPEMDPILPPLDPMLQDDQMDLEINLALDELLGLRGPISALIRNLLWLLAFNAFFLGIFAFIPRTVGSVTYAVVLNTTLATRIAQKIPFVHSNDPDALYLHKMVSMLDDQSQRLNTTFLLPDLATITLGYFSFAFVVVMWRFLWALWKRLKARDHDGNDWNEGRRQHRRRRAPEPGLDDEGDFHGNFVDGMDPQALAAGEALSFALDATVAFAKVGILLFLKMFLLPLLLGIWLDASTASLFGSTIEDRVRYAGSDLFTFILLHWVVGITFMLTVTVSVLQLREVVHPDLLARMIRPQEPQPDLLGNLLHEGVFTHTKRMALSLAIYAALLMMHVYFPVRILSACGAGDTSFFRLRFYHILMPQLQAPLELLVFHLSMLALLEKYKNSIGEMQHRWLVFMCKHLNLTDNMLPRSIEKFVLVGSKRLYIEEIDSSSDEAAGTGDNGGRPIRYRDPVVRLQAGSGRWDVPAVKVDPFWYELLSRKENVDPFILSNIDLAPTDKPPVVSYGDTKRTGERVIKISQAFIRLPPRPSSEDFGRSEFLPTSIGRFRLEKKDSMEGPTVVQIWKEVPTEPIPRPPEGWDDLGLGGADVQGRWAWGKERKSTIEGGIAQRTPFREPGQENWVLPWRVVLKIAFLLACSWVAITLLVCSAFCVPLAVGRCWYYILRVPERYMHDPLSFALGGCVCFPTLNLVSGAIKSSANRNSPPWRRFREWLAGLHAPPPRKLLALVSAAAMWLLVSPLALGVFYELMFVKTEKWFQGKEPFLDVGTVLLSWFVGTVFLNTWAFLAYFEVLTKGFWANIGMGMLEPPNEMGNNADAQGVVPEENGVHQGNDEEGAEDNDDTTSPRLVWQGKEGRIGKFFGIWWSALFRYEWDRVDPVALLSECAYPVAKHSCILLFFPFMAFWNPKVGRDSADDGTSSSQALYRMYMFRITATIGLLLQLCYSFQKPLRRWFRAAHKAARDDRYLIGEILLDYTPEAAS